MDAVIEVKASLSSREVLKDALSVLRSVKALDRTGGGENYFVLSREGQGRRLDPDDPEHHVWTAIIGETSLKPSTFIDEIVAEFRAQPPALWLNCYVSIHEYTMRFQDADGKLLWYPFPSRLDGIVLTDPERGEKPLVDFAMLLAGRLRKAGTVDYQPRKYFPVSRENQDWRRWDTD